MTLIEKFNSFCEASSGKVGAAERGLYVTLLDIWNKLYRPDWFDVSNTQLQRILATGSHNSITRWRNNLEKQGFLESKNMGKGKPLRIHLKELPTTSKSDVLPRQKVTWGKSKSDVGVRQKMTTSQSTEYTEITEYKSPSKVVPTFKVHTPPEREIPPLPDDLLNYYFRFNPTPKLTEKEKLAIWAEQYTVEKVKDAIDVAIENEAHHIKYIGRVLENNKGGAIKHDNMGGHTSQGESADEWADRLAAEYHL